MKTFAFWGACAAVLMALQLVVLHFGIHRRNFCFAAWLSTGVSLELLALCLYTARCAVWLQRFGMVDEYLSIGLALAAIAEAAFRSYQSTLRDPVNFTILLGVGAILAVNLAQGLLARHAVVISTEAWTWFRNVGFFGPAIFMLLSFSNVDFGRAITVARDAMASPRLAAALGFARSIVG